MSYFRQLKELEDQGIDLIEVLGQDRHLESPEALQRIIEQLSRSGDNLYSELLFSLTYRRFDPEQAETLWRAIMKHKARLTEVLGRKVHFRVAALDYMSTRSGILRQVRLLAKPEFETLLSYVSVDEVTGVYNRRYFNETLAQEIRRARRYSGEVSLLLIDVDDLKRVNDELGHQEGDAVLRKLGRLLRDSTRQTDSVCRYGGDELTVILPETSNAEAALLAERIRRAQASSASPGGVGPGPSLLSVKELDALTLRREGLPPRPADGPASDVPTSLAGVTLSIGGATYPGDCEEAEELVALADQMCLEAKRAGKNQIRMTDRLPPEQSRAAE